MLKTVLTLVSRLPFPVLYLLADILYFLAYKVLGYRKKVVRENLQRCFPEMTADELKETERDFYRNLADVVVESIKLLTISRLEITRRTNLVGIELLNNQLSAGQSCIILASHQANWEWLLLGWAAQLHYPIDALYKPLHNKGADELMLAIRSRFGAHMIPSHQIPRHLAARRGLVRALAMVADQTPMPGHSYRTQFLNRPTDFFWGAAKIAVSTQYPVFFTTMRRMSRGRYYIELQELKMPPHQGEGFDIIEAYAHKVEEAIKAVPSDWLWSHRRWKHIKDEPAAETGPGLPPADNRPVSKPGSHTS